MTINGLEDQHRQEIVDAITAIYGLSAIETAFITGSIPAGKARPDSDIDIFVCLSDTIESPDSKKQKFIDFYFDIHKRLGRESDPISPGELLIMSELRTAIERIQDVTPSAIVEKRDDFDAICWAGMMVSKRDILIPPSKEMNALEEMSRHVAHKWASHLAPDEIPTEGTGEYSDVDKILRRTISCPGYYDAH